jgi:hypothetical protein
MARHRRRDRRTRWSLPILTLAGVAGSAMLAGLVVLAVAQPAVAVVLLAVAVAGSVAYDISVQRRAAAAAERSRDRATAELQTVRRHAAADLAALRAELELLRAHVADGRDRLADMQESAVQLTAQVAAQEAELTLVRSLLADALATTPAPAAPDGAATHESAAQEAGSSDEMWPDLADAPTVVDLLAWDGRADSTDRARLA